MTSCFSFLSGKRGTLEISQAQQNSITEAQLEQAAAEFAQHGLPKMKTTQVSLKSTSSTRRSSITKLTQQQLQQPQVPNPAYFDRPIDTNTPVLTNMMPGASLERSNKKSCVLQ